MWYTLLCSPIALLPFQKVPAQSFKGEEIRDEKSTTVEHDEVWYNTLPRCPSSQGVRKKTHSQVEFPLDMWQEKSVPPCFIWKGERKRRYYVWLLPSPAAHWPRFTPGLNWCPLCFGGHHSAAQKARSHASKFQKWKCDMEWIRLGVWDVRTLLVLTSSPAQKYWYGVSRLVMLIGSLATGPVGNTSNTFEKKEAIKGIRKGTQILSPMDS